ncbi:TlpA family protein disulfide reductase [Ramlibacter terrae]|uniref:TlpA family protein disulfide reductase n=1 Tax=Ramlibacter terrae TaxID=2732511 RepID=A0ABX6P4U4_9BURK|nr:TlpA family protein disulfide reductase [Ramlibacter terrae]
MREGTNRRLVLALGAGAIAAGAGVGLWRSRAGGEHDAAVERLWTLDFQTPQGSTLSMASLKGRPLLVNFWATWCPPCVEEMPMLDAFFRQRSANGWQVVGLAIDQPSAVRTFLQRTPVTFPIGLAGLDGTALGKGLGNQTGGLPFTVVLDPKGQVRERRMGRVTEADLQAFSRFG